MRVEDIIVNCPGEGQPVYQIHRLLSVAGFYGHPACFFLPGAGAVIGAGC